MKKPLPERVDNRSVSTDLAVGARGDSRRHGRFPHIHTYLHVIIRCAVEPKYSHAHYRHNVCMTTMIQSMWRSCQVIICLCANKHKVLPIPPAGDRPWIHQSGADETDISWTRRADTCDSEGQRDAQEQLIISEVNIVHHLVGKVNDVQSVLLHVYKVQPRSLKPRATMPWISLRGLSLLCASNDLKSTREGWYNVYNV